MPNYVKTVMTFKNLKKTQMRALLNNITERDVVDVISNKINFDKIIPEPRTKEECHEKYILDEEHAHGIETSADRPWFNWYAWHIDHWDTKWNAYDGYSIIGNNTVTLVFSTAWSPAIPIFEKLIEDYKYEMEIRWADEDLGVNCGKIIYHKGYMDYEMFTEEDIPNPEKFAKRIWDEY